MPSAAPLTKPASSASPKLSAIAFCVVDQCSMVITHTMHADPSTCGSPSAEAPGKVRVRKRVEPDPLTLPRE
eukprot:3397203-Alexandrium_andersonii.AAC.1